MLCEDHYEITLFIKTGDTLCLQNAINMRRGQYNSNLIPVSSSGSRGIYKRSLVR